MGCVQLRGPLSVRMRIKLAIPDRHVTPEALEAVLEATMLANESAIRSGEVPALSDALSRGLKWKPEPFTDGEHFDMAEQVATRGWGDCDDLAPWLAGELRASGDDEGARPRVYKTGPDRWHVVVQTSDNKILDPSKWAGMKGDARQYGVAGSVARPMARPGGGALAVVPHDGAWWSRVDVPWADALGHLASHAKASTPEQALMRALHGAVCCGEEIESPLTDRAIACGRLLMAPAAEVGSVVEPLGRMFAHSVGESVAARSRKFLALSPEEQADIEAKLRKGLPKYAANMVLNQLKTGKKGGINAGKLLKAGVNLASSVIPGGGLANTALSMLTHGAGRGAKAPKGMIVHPSGGVSIPLEHDEPEHGQHMFISYHPAGMVGPVVMRF